MIGRLLQPYFLSNPTLLLFQHEMTLVNDTDIDRENIDEYLEELDHLFNQQLPLLSILREVSGC